MQGAHLELLDLQGRVLEQQDFHAQQGTSVDMEPYAPGLYLLRVTRGDRSSTVKLVRE